MVGGANPGEKRDMGSVVAFREGCRDLLERELLCGFFLVERDFLGERMEFGG